MALIGKNNHESVLREDASLFQVQETKTEKQKWKEMSWKQKLQYFRDYYFFKCLLCCFAAVLVFSFVWNALKPKKEQVLSAAVVHNFLAPEEKTKLEQHISKLLITDMEKQELRINDSLPDGYETDTKLTAYISAREVDLIITTETKFRELARTGCFENLEETMPEFSEKNKSFLFYAEGYLEESDIQQEDASETSNAYGISLGESDLFSGIWHAGKPAVAGIIQGSRNKENARRTLEELFFQ